MCCTTRDISLTDCFQDRHCRMHLDKLCPIEAGLPTTNDVFKTLRLCRCRFTVGDHDDGGKCGLHTHIHTHIHKQAMQGRGQISQISFL